jgi:serpin B
MKAMAFFLVGLLPFVLMCWNMRADAPAGLDNEAAQSVNAFATDLYAKLQPRPGNLFFSPASISSALGMAYAGARGSTAQEMATALHFNMPAPRLHKALGTLLGEVNATSQQRKYVLSMANALWAQQGHPFLPEFLRLVEENYYAGLHEVDFADPEAARQKINAWVEKQTHDKIKDLLAKGDVNPATRLVLTNAIYFKGDWTAPFQKRATAPAPFHLGKDKQIEVPMMHQTASFGYFDGGTFQTLELSYLGSDLAMDILLPKQADGLAEFEKQLSAERLAGWLGKLRGNEVVVGLPRFKCTAQFMLNDALSSLGMPMAFTPQADFSGMDGQKDLFFSVVVHKAYVDVNEQGTEAAAATGVGVRAVAAMHKKIIFQADHPFVFLIRDRRSGAILFLGRLENPSA